MRHRIPRLVAAIGVPFALLLALMAWGVSSPPGSSPDDDYHMASIWCTGGLSEGQCEEGKSADHRKVPSELVDWVVCYKFHPEVSAGCPFVPDRMVDTRRGNWYDNGYPPLFYATMSVFVTDDVSVSIIAMRSVNAVLYVGLTTALFFLLPRRMRTPLLIGAAITLVPLGMFLIPSVNPSSWAVISATGLWVAAWGFFAQTGLRKWLLAAMSVLLLVMGAGARSDAAVYGVLALIVASVLSFRGERRYLIDLLLPVGLTVVAVAFFFSGAQSAVVAGGTAVSGGQIALSTLSWVNLKALPELWVGAFGDWEIGGLGWLDTTMPGSVWATAFAIFAALTFGGLRNAGARKWIALGGVAAALVVVPMYILLHDRVVVGYGVQPRYIYPLVVIFGGLALVGLARDLGLGRVQKVVVAAGLTIANSVALHVNLRRYVTGLDNPTFNLNDPVEWWWSAPISPMAVWAGGSVLFALAAALVVWQGWRHDAVEYPRSDGEQVAPRSRAPLHRKTDATNSRGRRADVRAEEPEIT